MKKLSLFVVFAVSFIFFKIDVSALSDACTVAEQKRLKDLVAATKITYDYSEEKDPISGETYALYNVSISNFKPDFYVYSDKYGFELSYNNTGVSKLNGVSGGETYEIPFFASYGTACEGYKITSKSIRLIAYNKYSEDPICDGYETYELCKKFTQINITSYDEFVARVKNYIASLKNDVNDEQEQVPENSEKTMIEEILDFIFQNYMVFLISIIVLGTTGIVIIEAKKRRSIL